jgi:hypothetical protein
VVLAALATLIAGVVGLLRGGPPKGWDNDGAIVIDDQNGKLYIVDGGAMRPVANETSLRLAFPDGRPEPVRVDGETIASRPQGAVFGRTDLPAQPPRLVPPDSRILTCAGSRQPAMIVNPNGPPGNEVTALLNVGDSWYLASGGRVYPFADLGSAARLGYAPKSAQQVPAQLVASLPQGPKIKSIKLPKPRPLPRGTPPWMRTGSRVIDAGSRVSYVAVNGTLRKLENETTMRLIYGSQVPAGTRQPWRAIAPRIRPPFVAKGLPSRPPKLTDLAGRALCVDDGLRAVPGLPIAGLVSAPVPDSSKAVIWTPKDVGLLVAGSKSAAKAPSADDPVILLTEGQAFPIEAPKILRSLGYADQPITTMPQPWLDSLPLAEPLKKPS